MSFATHVRRKREALQKDDRAFSLRQVAGRVGLEPAYLSKIERGVFPPPSEEKIRALAGVLGEDSDVLLAMAGKVSEDLRNVILRRPRVFAELIRELKSLPDDDVLRIARQVRDGDW